MSIALFAARASDELAMRAIMHLETLGCAVVILEEEDVIPPLTVVFFTTSRNTEGSGWTGGRHSALVQLPEVPEWAGGAAGLVALRQNTHGSFNDAVEWAARFKESELGATKTPALWAPKPKKTRSRKPREKDNLIY